MHIEMFVEVCLCSLVASCLSLGFVFVFVLERTIYCDHLVFLAGSFRASRDPLSITPNLIIPGHTIYIYTPTIGPESLKPYVTPSGLPPRSIGWLYLDKITQTLSLEIELRNRKSTKNEEDNIRTLHH
jgi:hypothetical protein